MQKISSFAAKYRPVSTRILAIFLIALILFTGHSWEHLTIVDTLFEVIGLFLIGVCVMGRLWASVFVAGYKKEKLVTVGPYSLMRNPLYTFSFMGAAGISFLTENILVIITLLSVFIMQYYLVVLAEERELLKKHGEVYREYMEKVPRRFIPDFSRYIEPEQFLVNTTIYRKSFFDAIWFIWGIIPLVIIERLQELGIIPILFRVP